MFQDAAGNVAAYTHGFVQYFDLSTELHLPVADWIFSSEVGEHIPNSLERQIFDNLHRHNRCGMVLSWAVLGQPGFHHINNHSNDYIIAALTEMGYRYDRTAAEVIRSKVPDDGNRWLKNSLMLFERRPAPAGCAANES